MATDTRSPIYLERGRRWVFACSLDWPGWCRRGRGDAAAVETILKYGQRYARVVGEELFATPEIRLVGELASDMGPDFGAPTGHGPWDDEALDGSELERFVAVMEACWAYFDSVGARVSEQLRKGPRGGGRDRTEIRDHVREGERAYARKMGLSLPPRTAWEEQRAQLLAHWRSPAGEAPWPKRYGIRRCAWHVLDHAWEMEDRAG